MSREQNIDPPEPGVEPEPPPARPQDPIEPNPIDQESVPSLPATEPQPGELPKWDWGEHED